MAQEDGNTLNLEEFRILADRAGLALSTIELEDLKRLYDSYAEMLAVLHSANVGSRDLALGFSPVWHER